MLHWLCQAIVHKRKGQSILYIYMCVCVFTCAVTIWILLELVNNMTTQELFLDYCRFISWKVFKNSLNWINDIRHTANYSDIRKFVCWSWNFLDEYCWTCNTVGRFLCENCSFCEDRFKKETRKILNVSEGTRNFFSWSGSNKKFSYLDFYFFCNRRIISPHSCSPLIWEETIWINCCKAETT